jgi:hypothetical protein
MGSTRTILLPFASLTHSPPSAKVRSLGVPPMETVPVTTFCWGSIRVTVPSSSLATQSAPAAYVRAVGPLPTEIYRPFVAFSGRRAAINVASARLFVFAPEALLDASLDAPALVLAGDFSGVRPLEGETSLTGVTRFASDAFCEGLATNDGVVPIPNVLPYDAPR